jgi:predicted Zn-dependent peptidase
MPNQAKLALYFSGDREELFKRLSRRWGSWVKGEAAPFTFRGASDRNQSLVVLVDQPAEQEGIVRWGALAVSKDSRDYHALKVLEQYLTLSLPEWAQQISSTNQIRGSATLMAKKMPGYLQVSLRSPGKELVAYCRKLEQTIKLIRQGEIDLERFEEAKSLALREFRNSLREPFHQLYQLLGTDLCDLGLNYIPTYGLRLKRVTPTVLQGVIETYFENGRSVTVAAGSASQLGPDLEEIGTVEVLN